jgi:hypothetical protein
MGASVAEPCVVVVGECPMALPLITRNDLGITNRDKLQQMSNQGGPPA